MKWLRKWFPFDSPAYRWGLTHPFSKPRPWWSNDQYREYFETHGIPWEK